MGKVVGKIAKIAAVVAVAYFAPVVAAKLAPALLGSTGGAVMASTLGKAAASAVVGAGMGAAGGAVGIPGLNAKSGALAGGMSGLFGGKPTLGGAPANTATNIAAQTAQETGLTAAQSVGAGLTTAGTAGAAGGLASGLGAGLKAAAPLALGAALVGSGDTAQMKAQQAELERAQRVEQGYANERFAQAQRFMNEADRLDPDYMGRRAASEAMVRGSILEKDATRGLTGERLAAERRRARLGTARNVGSAYEQGYGAGVAGRTQTRAAGLSAIPTSFPTRSGELMGIEENRQRNQEAEQKGLGLIFGQVLGVPPITAPVNPG